jgi:hypothetical protein
VIRPRGVPWMKLFSSFVGAIAISVSGLASPLSAATVYTISDFVGSVTLGGTITTDGTLGVLMVSNITDFDVTLTTSIGLSEITKSNNQRADFIHGTALTATSAGLFFNFSGSGFFNILTNANWFMCASAGCTPDNVWSVNGGGKLATISQFGNIEIAIGPPVPVDTTPLPAALPLFATGLGALGLLGWRRRRKITR